MLLGILAGSCSSVLAQDYTRYLYEIDTPTAFTLPRGSYQFSILAYDEGGVEFKTIIGLHDNIFLGVSFDMEHAIGKDKPDPNVPGVIARVKLTDGWQRFPISLAFGYDSFYLGSVGKVEDSGNNEEYDVDKDNNLNRMIYGPYFVITKPVYLLTMSSISAAVSDCRCNRIMCLKIRPIFCHLTFPWGNI